MVRQRMLGTVGAIALTAILAGCGASSGSAFTLPSNQPQTATPSTSSSTSARATSPSLSPTETSAAPEILSKAGSLETNVSWPLAGAKLSNTGRPMSSEQFTSAGFTIDGVHWTWPQSDPNPDDYLVVPTVVAGKPFLVWAHLGAHTGTGFSFDPSQPSTVWMTPWTKTGGRLDSNATLITNDIPPVWSKSGQWNFPNPDTKPGSPSVNQMAETAWTGWFHWGSVADPYTPTAAKRGSTASTVAWPSTLSPAYNGVVLVVTTKLLGANQGQSSNVYYLNLTTRRIVGLASLTNGGGFFDALASWNGLVVTGESTDDTADTPFPSAMVAYNQRTGKRQWIQRSNPDAAGFTGGYQIIGHALQNQDGAHVATLNISVAELYGPSPNPF
ncbi:hypothetical protein [Sulfobacillus harzensis]|uniref:Uncharacterized protein n=1 Tax=Sulfobacillus harzensis TaxID=2729629 RepID=A0A7Y0L8E2_9FIRM|nr:hypothetical protein [Sulfobacillus harzensis]NMP24877.1 hypothetical protein [Sulfobacillus harzensis]